MAAVGDVETGSQQFEARQLMSRLGTAEEIAEAALHLASDVVGFVTGSAFSTEGSLSL